MQLLNVDRNVLTSNLADFSGGETTDIPPENDGLESNTNENTDSQEVIENEPDNIELSDMTKAELLDYAENVENSVENVKSEDIEENAE